ncbi:response regulator transcription factor [Parachitinimonas caeni]|uniref:DNA-binding response regulator n=1 Tax=Parachitinimonas caeni TaxID=3031301 RepID=A0ABT7DYU2_9NEIS|nr:DNA-binding response regulator [Parachitinimonas caeni]MDK2125222.1 DNA-binding response regulator [Parachitinimonas caeni]
MALFNVHNLEKLEAQNVCEPDRPLVLVVDDEEHNRRVIRAILEPHYRILEAEDGEAALQCINALDETETLACVISDQRMPRLTGVELFQRLAPILPRVLRIIVTGYLDIDAIVDSINKAEIYKFIVKPFDRDDFLLTVKRAVEAFEMQRKLDRYHSDLEQEVEERTRQLLEKTQELDGVLAVLRQNRAIGADQRGAEESWNRRYCAICDANGHSRYIEHGFEALIHAEWPNMANGWPIDKIASFLHAAEETFVGNAVMLAKRNIEGCWFIWARGKLPIDSLTPRELTVVEAMAEGLSHKEIAQRLDLSPATVRSHIQRIHEKLNVKTNAELIAKCFV